MNTKLWVGSYSAPSGDGIYPFELDRETGRLTPAGRPVKAVNPSYLAFGRDKRFLYAVCETLQFQGTNGGGAAAYRIVPDGGLEFLGAAPTGGSDPCYLCTDRGCRFLVTANYTGGSFTLFPLGEDGGILPRAAVVQRRGGGPDKQRQEAAHVHFTAFTPDEKALCAVDLGGDRVAFYRLDRQLLSFAEEESRSIPLRPGTGPRHLVFSGRFLYLLSELSSEVLVLESDGDRYALRQTLSALPSGFSGYSAAAAIRLSPDGRFLYASNRGHNSIAVFRVERDGLLSPAGRCSCGGNWPRDIAITPEGDFLLAANEKSGEVTAFRVDRASGALDKVGGAAVHRPTCILFA